MASIGINFRGSSGYVSDGAGETYCLGSDTYPTTRGGFTFGWEDAPGGGIDRDATNDARLAGINYAPTAGTRWRLDLPATGDYLIRLAIGDAASGQGNKFLVKDDGTLLLTRGIHNTSGADRFFDAAGVEYTDATWPGSNTGASLTFATTILRLVADTSFGNNCIAHLYAEQVGGGGGGATPSNLLLLGCG